MANIHLPWDIKPLNCSGSFKPIVLKAFPISVHISVVSARKAKW